MAVLGPADVTGIDPLQIVRREPIPGTIDADWSLLPAVEFAVPDLPWLLTPAGAGRATGAAALGSCWSASRSVPGSSTYPRGPPGVCFA